MKIVHIIASILPVIALVLVGVQLFASNALAGLGRGTLTLDQTIEQIRSENQRLRQEIATGISLRTLETKAKELGFTYSSATVTLLPADVAYNRVP